MIKRYMRMEDIEAIERKLDGTYQGCQRKTGPSFNVIVKDGTMTVFARKNKNCEIKPVLTLDEYTVGISFKKRMSALETPVFSHLRVYRHVGDMFLHVLNIYEAGSDE